MALEFLYFIDAKTMVLGLLFIVLFAIINFALMKSIKNKGLSAIISFAISLFAIYGINKTRFDPSEMLYNIGLTQDLLYTVVPILIILGLVLLSRRFGFGKILLIVGVILSGLSFTELIYEKGVLLAIGIGLIIIGGAFAYRKSKKDKLSGADWKTQEDYKNKLKKKDEIAFSQNNSRALKRQQRQEQKITRQNQGQQEREQQRQEQIYGQQQAKKQNKKEQKRAAKEQRKQERLQEKQQEKERILSEQQEGEKRQQEQEKLAKEQKRQQEKMQRKEQEKVSEQQKKLLKKQQRKQMLQERYNQNKAEKIERKEQEKVSEQQKKLLKKQKSQSAPPPSKKVSDRKKMLQDHYNDKKGLERGTTKEARKLTKEIERKEKEKINLQKNWRIQSEKLLNLKEKSINDERQINRMRKIIRNLDSKYKNLSNENTREMIRGIREALESQDSFLGRMQRELQEKKEVEKKQEKQTKQAQQKAYSGSKELALTNKNQIKKSLKVLVKEFNDIQKTNPKDPRLYKIVEDVKRLKAQL